MSIDIDFQFRAVLLKIQDSLSPDDRMKLHFLFGDDIPRVLRENGSLEESIRVLQTLFERMKISSENVDYLLTGLRAIQRFDCVKQLEEYKRMILPTKILTKPEQVAQPVIEPTTQAMLNDLLNASDEQMDEIKVVQKFECPPVSPLDRQSIDLSPFENESSIWSEEYSRSLDLPFHPRNYQIEIVRDAIQHGNSIICLRTGSGKTFIASLLIKYFWIKNFTKSTFRVLFFVPRKAIRLQQAKAIAQIGNLRVKICHDDEKISEILDETDVIVLTPQKFVNALEKGAMHLSQIDLMIFDECHNTSGGNPFCKIMKSYLCPSRHNGQRVHSKFYDLQSNRTHENSVSHFPIVKLSIVIGDTTESLKILVTFDHVRLERIENRPRIFGLTASISSKDSIEKHESIEKNMLSICSKLSCENISTVCRKENLDELNRDVGRPMNDPFEFLSGTETGTNFKEILTKFDEIIRKILDQLAEKTKLKDKTFESPCFSAELVLLKRHFEMKGQTTNVIIVDYLTILTKKYSSLFDLPFSMVFQHILSQIENYHRLCQVTTPIDSILYEFSTESLRPISNFSPENSKLKNLITLIKRHASPQSQGLILVQTTFYAKILCDFLNENDALKGVAKATWIVGQSSSDFSQTINEQEEKLKLFRDGDVNILVATDIVQEGLDVPTCSFVIRYEFVSDEIGTIQSRGRARAQNSSYYLITERDSLNHQREKLNRIREENMEKTIDEWSKIDRELFRRNVETAKVRFENENSLIVEWEREIARELAERTKLKKIGKKNGSICCRKCNGSIGEIVWLRRRNTTYFVAQPEFFEKNETQIANVPKNFHEIQMLGEVKCRCGNSLGGYQRFTDRTDLGPSCALKCKQIKFLLENETLFVEFNQWSLNNRFDVEEFEEI